MATVNAVVYDQLKREDGTYHVQIKLFHEEVRRFIETNQYVTARQLDENLKIKDKHILKSLDEILTDYRKTIGDLAPKLDFFTCYDLKAYLVNKDKEVDFIAFCSQHIASLREAKRDGIAYNHRAVRNSLVDYFKKQSVSILEINSGMLFAYEKWLQTDRAKNQCAEQDQPCNNFRAYSKRKCSVSNAAIDQLDMEPVANGIKKF